MIKENITEMEKKGSIDTAATAIDTGKGIPAVIDASGLNGTNVKAYLNKEFYEAIKQYSARDKVYSGFMSIDAQAGPGLTPGLYIFGAGSSMGKTTFALQMADQIAESGGHVIYFTLEQSAFELVSKSISRIMARNDMATALTALKIRELGTDVTRIEEAVAEYNKYCGNITIVECGFGVSITDIESYVEEYIKKLKITPVVIVDYLQLIKAPENVTGSKKELVDMYMELLKDLQLRHGLIVIAISSLNRSNYLSEVDFESFKESGGIEYGADVVWGLQLKVLSDQANLFATGGRINEKRIAFREAKKENPRRVELICLKNRSGEPVYECSFRYYPAFDFFEDDGEGVDQKLLDNLAYIKAIKDDQGFSCEDIYEQIELPF